MSIIPKDARPARWTQKSTLRPFAGLCVYDSMTQGRVLRRTVPALVWACWIVGMSSPVATQSRDPSAVTAVGKPLAFRALTAPSTIDLRGRRLLPDARALGAQSRPRVASRDTLSNGALIGAIAGGVALGTVGAIICRAYREPGGPSCLPDTLRFAAVGGAVGGGIGVAVDAAFSRHAGMDLRLRVSF
jgi:hypothetical protein